MKPLYVTAAEEETYSKTLLGFWIYLMTDCILFATLFATYAVLHGNTYGGPGAKEVFSLPYALGETLVLLISSYFSGLGMLSALRGNRRGVLFFFAMTFLLGVSFLLMEMHEFTQFVAEGNSWQRSGFFTAYFSLVGTHGLHITCGLVWMGVLFAEVWRKGITAVSLRRLACLSLFWHFLDIIWIFIFTFVYLLGVS